MSIKIHFEVNDAALRDEFLSRKLPEAIALLQENTKPDWGKMSTQHMTEH